ncbi:uncharacterized protein PHALS_10881 [Plasmopara halstedii]|uniref:Uncharacterized protein n=1 Tax=Plasmopara halstedii TaxID=4781 RepID=A0A0P1AHV2_PLAHL|nr:uncharacterized protein PHALS_10881 [Plasmopara halstedii]CEG40697.1 hypothetical protein PHALS_10881 [Plasmopara halstedii]|eukprot:XP_024577066.1 hypothetical protein PHALS_10881 [Plasmopara halstedii]
MLANGDRVHESCDVSWDRWLKVENTPRRSEQTSTKSNDRDVIIYVARELQEIWNSFRSMWQKTVFEIKHEALQITFYYFWYDYHTMFLMIFITSFDILIFLPYHTANLRTLNFGMCVHIINFSKNCEHRKKALTK